MANIIDKTYFFSDLSLPKGEFSAIDEYITKFERRVLVNLLGEVEYNKLIATPNVEPYKSLIEGAEYDVSYAGGTRKVKWIGLKNAQKESLIAYYVYCEFLRKTVTSSQSVGEVKSLQMNSNFANVGPKIHSAWCVFEEMYGYRGQDILTPSAANYLEAHESSFPDIVFTELTGSINSHDI